MTGAELKIKEDEPGYKHVIPNTTMAKIGNHIVVDPNGDEWASMSARVTITTDSDGNICALQKGGSDGFTLDEMVQCGETSIRVGKQIREKLKAAQEGVQ